MARMSPGMRSSASCERTARSCAFLRCNRSKTDLPDLLDLCPNIVELNLLDKLPVRPLIPA